MTEKFALTLYDYRNTLQWVRELGWSDDDLSQVPVHEQASSGDEYLNLTNMGGTALGVSAVSGGGTSADVTSVRNMYVYKGETPAHLYKQLDAILQRGGTSGYEDGKFGEVGDRDDFPPR